MADRGAMIAELKRVVQPYLRAEKFAGTFPHFRRAGEEAIDLITFQFDRHGGCFVVEIARCPRDGVLTYWGVHLSPAKVRAWDVNPNFRKRVKPRPGSGTDSWFRYETSDASKVAAEALSFLSEPGLWADVRIGSSRPSP
jgi:hypothetical protein